MQRFRLMFATAFEGFSRRGKELADKNRSKPAQGSKFPKLEPGLSVGLEAIRRSA
jgi:hypothetical protein